jgi:predicted phage terminase large subunit-like protein
MQETQIKEKLKSAIEIYRSTRDPRAGEVVEHLNKILSTSKSRKSLIQYAKHMYPGYKDPAHIQLIAKHLEMLERGDIKRLAVFMPPRHGKSMLCSEFFPAWYLGNNPNEFVIQSTYAQELADDFGRKVRNQVVSPDFNSVFPQVGLRSDSTSAKRFHTVQGGTYSAVGAGGAITGRGAHLLIIDDPIKGREDAESAVQRKNLIEWYKAVAYTRLQPGGKIIIVQTRWHQEDLAGYILNESGEDWKVLDLPAIDDSGNALWPEAYSKEDLEKIKATVGTRVWSALYQQQPTNEEGSIIKRDWWNVYLEEKIPTLSYIIQSYDTAYSTRSSADFSACTTWGVFTARDENNVPYAAAILLDAWKDRLEYPDLRKKAQDSYYEWRPDQVLIEKKASGQSLIQDLRRAGVPVITYSPDRDKISRTHSVASMFEGGLVFTMDQDWTKSVIEESAQFPYGKHDDIHDTCVQALLRIRDGFLITHPDDIEDENYETRKQRSEVKHYYS